ncbi:MAG: hypothetical protein EAZ06_09765 [Cytophagales bacterium]|nr:MAG: hypothetical protein EAY69_03300 [Cytophagales bacterium]TAH28543.1 MAG: hypothetical protein EAZ06_09765 [Cytophagales bacterium]
MNWEGNELIKKLILFDVEKCCYIYNFFNIKKGFFVFRDRDRCSIAETKREKNEGLRSFFSLF